MPTPLAALKTGGSGMIGYEVWFMIRRLKEQGMTISAIARELEQLLYFEMMLERIHGSRIGWRLLRPDTP